MASSDASPIIWLSKCSNLHLLDRLYSAILIPEAVYVEAVVRGLEGGYEDAKIIKEAVEEGWIKVHKVDRQSTERVEKAERRLAVELGTGEREAIALALEKEASNLLTDDEDAYQVGRSLGLNPKGVLHVLLKSVKEGHLSKRQASEKLGRIIEEGFWISSTITHSFHEALDKM